jgi:hypothetical protein
MLALAAHYGYECKQYDIVTAFLNAVMDGHQIYVELPHGFEDYVIQLAGMATVADSQQLACLLLRALYGLKQSPMLWYQEFEKFIRNLGFTPLFADACLFRHGNGCIIIIYVDDVLAMALTKAIVKSAVTGPLRDAFKLRELGDVSFYLGCRILRDIKQRKIWLIQDAYLEQTVAKYLTGTGTRRTRETPMSIATYNTLAPAPAGYEASANLKSKYQSLVGSLMWPAIITRPDITFCTNHLAQYLVNPTKDHFDAALDVLRYLNGTIKRGICLTGGTDNDLDLRCFVDAAFADDRIDRKSSSGYVFKLAGGPISWKSGKQPIVTLSSTEAEYVALTITAKEAVYVRKLLTELHYPLSYQPVKIFEDNQPAINLTDQSDINGRSKYI